MIFKLDSKGKILFADSPSFLEFGLPKNPKTGHALADLLSGEDKAKFADALDRLKKEPYSCRFETAAGKSAEGRIEWRLSGIPDESGNLTEIIAAGRKATNRGASEIELAWRLELEALVENLFASFVDFTPEGVDEGIDASLERIGRFMGADRCHILQYHDNNTRKSMTHEWTAKDVPPGKRLLQNLPVELFKWSSELELAGRLLFVPDVSKLGPEAEPEKAIFEKGAIKTMLGLPLIFEGGVFGTIGMHSLKEDKQWTVDSISLLKVAGQIIASALMHKKSDETLQMANRSYKLLSECNQALVRADNESDLLDEICRLIVEIGGYRLAWIGFAENDEAKTVRVAARHGFEEGYLDKLGVVWSDTEKGRGPSGSAIRTGKPTVCRDIATDPLFEPWRAEAEKRGYQSSLSLPMTIESGKRATLNVYSTRPNAFGDEEIKLLEELANDLAYGIRALRNALRRDMAEQELRQSRKVLQKTLSSLNEAVLLAHPAARIIEDCNETAEKIFGWSRDEMIGRDTRFLHLDEEMFALFGSEMNKSIRKQGWFETEFQFMRKNGEIFPTENFVTALFDEEGKPFKVVSVVRDITARKKAEEKLRLSEEMYRTISESADDYIFLLDRNLTLQYLNPAGARQFGALPEHFVGKSLQEVFPPETFKAQKLMVEKVFDTGKAITVERKRPFPTGDRWLNTRLAPVFDASGGVCNVMGISRDATAQKRAEEENTKLQRQLLQAQKMEAIGQLAGGVAHDFNNMLAIILGNANLGLLDLKPGDKCRDEFREIMEAARRAKDLSMKMLTFARKEKLEVRPISAADIIDELKAILSRSLMKNIQIETALENNLPNICVDANQIHQAMLNICVNARDAMPEGGLLTIRAGRESLNAEAGQACGGLEPGDYCVIKIADTGVGMTEEVSQKVFEPFFTTKGPGKGTGLGMSVTFGIIKNHGGYIEASSQPGEGSTFAIYLPFTEQATESETPDMESEAADWRGIALVVDDEPQVLKMASKALEKLGYDAIACGASAAAIEIYKNRHSEIDLVLLDFVMPEIDGAALYKALKQINPNVKAIIFSGYSMDGQVGPLLQEGVEAFIQKPFTVKELDKAIKKTMESG